MNEDSENQSVKLENLLYLELLLKNIGISRMVLTGV